MAYQQKKFRLPAPALFKKKVFAWAAQHKVTCYLDHNGYKNNSPNEFEALAAVGVASQILRMDAQGAFGALQDFQKKNKGWLFGYMTYDLKNEVENLRSENFDGIGFPALHFFEPVYLVEISGDRAVISSQKESPEILFQNIEDQSVISDTLPSNTAIGLQPRISKKEYLETVEAIRQHIHRGDIYEMNFCQEFFAEGCQLDAPAIFQKLNALGKAPFSCFYKLESRFLLCASPERFLKKTGNRLVSQPIKGTVRRGNSEEEDEKLKTNLLNSQKDRSENVMIVDLVRNDLHRSCEAGSVKVDEMFGVYTFEQVHQLISTVSGRLKKDVHFVEALRRAFPMGSMTGAPKVRSMELAEQYEKTKRGLYSGAVGYLTPDGDFDFNVVIRSILYNETEKYVSVQVGGAIVYDSVAEQEYEECWVKAKGMFEVLGGGIL